MTPLPLYDGPGDTGELVQQPDAVTFLAARAVHAFTGGWSFAGPPWPDYSRPRVHSGAADALAMYGVGVMGLPPTAALPILPRNESDLAACERTYLMAPDDVRERMLPVLVEYRAHVAGRGQG